MLTFFANHSCLVGIVTLCRDCTEERTVLQASLCPFAGHSAHDDGQVTLSVHGARLGLHRLMESQLTADARGVFEVPVNVAYHAPLVMMVDLHSAAEGAVTVHQPHNTIYIYMQPTL